MALAGADSLVSAAHIKYAPALISACRQAGVGRAVFFSSTWRFSRFQTPEVKAVIAGEEAVEASRLSATVLRPTTIYGPGDDRNISRLRDYLVRRRVMPVFGSGEQLVQPVFVEDVAAAAVAALRLPGAAGKAYEIAGAHPIPYSEMIDALARAVGRTVLKVYVPVCLAVPLVRAYGWAVRSPRLTVDQVRRTGEDRAFDISAAVRDLGFAPRSFDDGIRETIRTNERGGP